MMQRIKTGRWKLHQARSQQAKATPTRIAMSITTRMVQKEWKRKERKAQGAGENVVKKEKFDRRAMNQEKRRKASSKFFLDGFLVQLYKQKI